MVKDNAKEEETNARDDIENRIKHVHFMQIMDRRAGKPPLMCGQKNKKRHNIKQRQHRRQHQNIPEETLLIKKEQAGRDNIELNFYPYGPITSVQPVQLILKKNGAKIRIDKSKTKE